MQQKKKNDEEEIRQRMADLKAIRDAERKQKAGREKIAEEKAVVAARADYATENLMMSAMTKAEQEKPASKLRKNPKTIFRPS